MRNFIAAVKISQYGLPVAAPLAAVYRRGLFCRESIYISEYVEGVNLYEFLKNLPRDNRDRYRTVRQLSEQIAEIFAVLHEKGLWHRDAKATNFVVYQNDGGYEAAMTDMDGIKQYSTRRESRQMQGLWRLAASVTGLASVNRTDYLRTFEAYCEKVGLPKEERAKVFRQLSIRAQAKSRRV